MKALTLKPPWAWAIFYAGKDFENRSWPLPKEYLGQEIVIHNGKSIDNGAAEWILWNFAISPSELDYGLVGKVVFDKVVTKSSSPWYAQGQFGWHISKKIIFPKTISCKGSLGLWDCGHLLGDST